MQSTLYDLAVIGGGPAGMMAAGRAAELGASVVLVEKNPSLGKKLLITGGGRCNICNAEFDQHKLVEKYGKSGKALFSAFSQFNATNTFEFFESRGLKLKIEAEKRAFPASDRAEDVWKTMLEYLRQGNVTVLCGSGVRALKTSKGMIDAAVTRKGDVHARTFIVATGGMSHPETGSTGEGFGWLKDLGHTVTEASTALVPVAVKEPWVKDLSGLSFKNAKVTVVQSGNQQSSRVGKMLFTHFGVSGPLILNMSRGIGDLLEAGEVTLSVDFFPSLDAGAVDRLLLDIIERNKNKLLKNGLIGFLPPRLTAAIITLAKLDGEQHLYRLSKEARGKIVALAKAFHLTASHLLGEDDAVVTSGGGALNEVDFKTMRSKKMKNLLLAGDGLDFDRPSGGFSLQICWTTGWVAGGAAHVFDVRSRPEF